MADMEPETGLDVSHVGMTMTLAGFGDPGRSTAAGIEAGASPVSPAEGDMAAGAAPGPPDPDLPLVHAMAHGDTDALEALYARQGGGVLAYLVHRLGDRLLAEEVLQDVMLAAWRAAGGFRGDARVRTWLLTIAHHRAVNASRRRRVPQVSLDAPDRGPAIAAAVAAAPALSVDGSVADRIDLRAAVLRLPADQRATLGLVFFQGLSVEEAATVLDVAPGTVKSRLHRARRALAHHLSTHGNPDEDV